MHNPEKIRNLAIIAHIDHGKTTLMDALLSQCDIFKEHEKKPTRAMDSFSLEKERGITIFSKHTSLYYEDYKLNIIDTPGHADFSGEVERVLGMVSGVLLLVDAQEGPMPQTRFVLSSALKAKLKILVVLNKIDRPHADPDFALNKTFDLFVELGADDAQLDFPFCYASAIEGFAMKELDDPRVNVNPLFEMIVDKIPAPSVNREAPFLMQASTLSYNNFVGRLATGRILQGKITLGSPFSQIDSSGKTTSHKVAKIEGYHGLEKTELNEAFAGDIVSIAGAENVMIGDTLCDPNSTQQLPPIELGEPTLSVTFLINSSPFVGKEGKHVTFNKIKDRLNHEKKANISLGIAPVAGREDAIVVSGRGELHLSILIETLRRENYEFSVSKPQVITKMIDGKKCEPYEIAHLEMPEEFSGKTIEELSKRKGTLKHLATNEHSITQLEFYIPTRSLSGFRSYYLTLTKGQGIITSLFDSFAPIKEGVPERTKGVLIASHPGKATPYSIFNLQSRGTFFISESTEVYEGMIVGENTKENDLCINVTKGKQLTNVRASGTDENVIITPPKILTLEAALDFIENDELIEVTPKSIRLRKIHLKEIERKQHKKATVSN